MRTINFADIDLLEVGNSIQLGGAIYSDNGTIYLVPFPDEDQAQFYGLVNTQHLNPGEKQAVLLSLDTNEMAKFLEQTDVLNVAGAKAILRKSQRQIDQHVSWSVFRRDKYKCRYCGKDDVPLTVDHIDLWEDGGATVYENLNTACRACNKARGRTPYPDWIASPEYRRRSSGIDDDVRKENEALAKLMPELQSMRMKVRSR